MLNFFHNERSFFMQEKWKDIAGYEGIYQISNLGRVKNTVTKEIKKQSDNGKGYKSVNLWKQNKGQTFYIHRLVAGAFIENTLNKPEVHHIDSDRSNNTVENLTWVTTKENNNLGKHIERMTKNKRWIETRSTSMAKAREKSIVINSYKTKFTKGDFVKVFESLAQGARELGLDKGGCTRVANGKQKHTHGYKVEYI